MVTEKIGIIYDLKNKVLKHSDDQPIMSTEDNFLKDTFVTIKEPNELNNAINKALNPSKIQIENIKRNKDKYFYKNDGKASQRIKTYIDKLSLQEINAKLRYSVQKPWLYLKIS